jgi:nicotinic acid mononucleotide adenylyltransferase
VGVGATASLASDRPKKGEHRCHIAAASDAAITHISIVLEKGLRERVIEEEVVGTAIIYCIATTCGVATPSLHSILGPNDQLRMESAAPADWMSRLLRAEIDRITVLPDGQVVSTAPIPGCVLAGSFDPLHAGHLGLSRAAAELLGLPVSFEISAVNVDKPPLGCEPLRRRAEQFLWWANVELTRAPTFAEKSRLFPGASFVIGADTAERIVAPKYYAQSESNMIAALEQIARRGCTFLVAARANVAGQVRSLADLAIPAHFEPLFRPIPESRFRLDISSSAIRLRTQKQKL